MPRRTKRNVEALLHKQVGKDAAAILRKVENMLKQGAPRAKIEKALIVELSDHIRHVCDPIMRVHHAG